MINYFRVFLLFLSLSFSVFTYGISVGMSYSKPVIENGIYKQFVILSSIKDVNGPEFDYPTGVCPRESCYVGLAVTDKNGIAMPDDGSVRVLVGPIRMDGVDIKPRVSDILNFLDAYYLPLLGMVSKPIYNSHGPICIGIILQSSRAQEIFVGPLHHSLVSCSDGSGGGILPPPPDPMVSCSMAAIIELDHGKLTNKNVNDHLASQNVTIKCSDKATVRLSFSKSKVDLYPAKGLSSYFYLKDSLSSVDLVVDKSLSVKVSSQLKLVSDTGIDGAFSGSAILNMNVL